MTKAEILFHLLTVALLFRISIYPERLRPLKPSYLVIAGSAALVLTLVLTPYRWQLLPSAVVFLVSSLLCLKRRRAGRGWRALGIAVGGTTLLIGGFIAWQLPVRDLTPPKGPYVVGTFGYSVVDESRTERFDDEGFAKREIAVQVWYPAEPGTGTNGYPRETLWPELYLGPADSISLLTAYLGNIHTHSHRHAPVAAADAPFPILLYNPGMGSFVSDNTLLMEHWASHGYIVVGVTHPYEALRVHLDGAGPVLMDWDGPASSTLIPLIRQQYQSLSFDLLRLPRDTRSTVKTQYLELLDQVVQLGTEQDKLNLIRQTIQRDNAHPVLKSHSAEATLAFIQGWSYQNASIAEWVKDSALALDSIQRQHAIPGFADALDLENIGVSGYSFGGAAAGEFCKLDSRCRAGLNMDGEQFGAHWDSVLGPPFLMLYSGNTAGHSDFAVKAQARNYWECIVKDARHADFNDIATIMPVAKKLAPDHPFMFGDIQASDMNAIVQEVTLAFFDDHLKSDSLPGQHDQIRQTPCL